MQGKVPPVEAAVLLGRCSRTSKLYGIRVEQRANDWYSTWAFPITSEASAKREEYGSQTLHGTYSSDVGWPGCPHCGSGSWAACNCGRIGCWDGTNALWTCPWCHTKDRVEVRAFHVKTREDLG
jgi:hypothetical protein